MEVVSLWLAVDPSTTANGCLRVVPGSHRHGVHAMRDRGDVASVFGNESAVAVDESQRRRPRPRSRRRRDPPSEPAALERAQHSPTRRCGLTIRYIPTSTRILTEEQPYASAFHLRGAPGVNIYQPCPVFDPARHFPFAMSPPSDSTHAHHESCSGATRASTARSSKATAP